MSQELSELPEAWVACRLKDICDIRQGQSPPSSSYTDIEDSIGVPFLQGNAEFGDTTPTPQKRTTAPKVVAREGSVLLSVRAPVGDTNYAPPGDTAIGRGLAEVKPLGGISPSFVYWVLRAARPEFESLSTGTTFGAITGRVIQDLNVALPPLEEQRRIVDRIEALCADIDIGRQELAKAANDLGQLEHALRIRATEGHPLVNLGSLVSSIRYGTSVRCTADADGPPVLRIPNIRGGEIDVTDLKFATKPGSELGDCFTETGDLLFIRTNGSRDLIGGVAVVNEDAQFAFASYLIRARPSERLDPQWAVMALSAPRLRADLEARAASTAGQYNLNIQSLRSLEIPLPPLDEQRRLVRVVRGEIAAVATVLFETREADATARALIVAVLQRSFRGELSTRSPEDRPATAILEAIAQSRAAASAAQRSKPRERRGTRAAATSDHTDG